jgi:ATP-dependent RNA helicase SUPV3L1/SUV3
MARRRCRRSPRKLGTFVSYLSEPSALRCRLAHTIFSQTGRFPLPAPTDRVRAILGPTNTGKTHLAVERMLAHGTGMIGLPLRLLAREIYDRMVREKGVRSCALITGEERIRPEGARYMACTVEAMPAAERADFIAIDEIQLATDPDRGHVFTDRILHARGRHETMLLGADTMRPALQALDLEIDAERRERFSQLSYAGPIKITKLPKRSAVVAFSAEEVYAIAELLKRQRGGCAVIMGALSPRTRNAQVDLYQSGEVDYIVATDAIGMGLNLDVGHIAFASRRKFDGKQRRLLRADELAQIAGRAGRFRDDGTFGETADCEPFDEDTIRRITEHHFEPVDCLNWRNADLDWSSLAGLQSSLKRPSRDVILRRAPEALDELTLTALAQQSEVRDAARDPAHVRRLWDLCTLPDFRKSGQEAHVKLVGLFHEKLAEPAGRIKDEWMFAQVERLDRTEGDLDTLQNRLAGIRTWTYAANRADWLENAETWRTRTREIEDKLSDALHERLMQRFVDRRTSALLKTLNAQEDAPADVTADGRVKVGGHDVGHLNGLQFTPEKTDQALEGRALR